MTKPYFAPGFRRRTYQHPLQLLRDLVRIVRVSGSVLLLSTRTGISAGFRERLMLVVTGVNRCRHCAYGHEILAHRAGLSRTEIADLLMLDLRNCPEQELPGLRYAIHWAECDGQPSADARAFLEGVYGAAAARQVDTACLLIHVGNRVGNTFDFMLGWLSRGRFGLLPDERRAMPVVDGDQSEGATANGKSLPMVSADTPSHSLAPASVGKTRVG